MQVLAGAPHGGAETAFVDMCIAYKQAGHEVMVVTRQNPVRVPRLEKYGIEVHTLPFGGRFDFYTGLRLGKVIEKFEPCIVQTWMSRAAQHTPSWSAKMKCPEYKVVSRLGGYYKLKYFRNTDYFATITPDIGRYLVEDCGVNESRVRHINNFAETEREFEPLNRADYNTPKDASLCLALGRLHHSKAFDVLIEAFKDLPDVHLWIAGEGPDRDELDSLISDLNLNDRVQLLGWRNDRAALFDAADICVFPSRYEPFGTVFVQSWAMNTPLVTTESQGPKQFVKHEEDGLVVPIDNVKELREVIKRLVSDRDLQAKLVKNGSERYLHEFTKEKCVENYINYFNEILVPKMNN